MYMYTVGDLKLSGYSLSIETMKTRHYSNVYYDVISARIVKIFVTQSNIMHR